MSGFLNRRAWLAPIVLLTTSACFATRSDMRILQTDLQASRAEMNAGLAESAARAEANRRHLDSMLIGIGRGLALVTDSVRSVQAVTMRLRGDVREDLTTIRTQLITVEQLVGASTRRIQELRAALEADATERAAPIITPTDSSRLPVAGAAPAGPGPAQFYQMGQDQLRRGSWGSARGAFHELLTQFPSSDLVVDALFGIGQSFENDGQGASADSVYALVVERFPKSERAPTALYKRATALRVTGQVAAAQALYKVIVEQYPRSDAAVLAEGFLGTRKP